MKAVFSIDTLIKELNEKNKEVVKHIESVGLTSLGYKAEYYSKGRTIYKGTYVNPKYSNPIKVGVFTKAKGEDIYKQLIKKEIIDIIESFKSQEAHYLCSNCSRGFLEEDSESIDAGVCVSCGEKSYYQDCEEITLTKDNIHLYYSFLVDEQVLVNSLMLDEIFEPRFAKVLEYFKVNTDVITTHEDKKYNLIFTTFSNEFQVETYKERIYGIVCHGVIDELKPIDEYIKDIENRISK